MSRVFKLMIGAIFSSSINILSIIGIKFCSGLDIRFLSLLEWKDKCAFTLHLCYAELVISGGTPNVEI